MQMAALNESSGNWEYHPTVPPPPMGSPQVRLELRGSVKTFLYASSDSGTLSPEDREEGRQEMKPGKLAEAGDGGGGGSRGDDRGRRKIPSAPPGSHEGGDDGSGNSNGKVNGNANGHANGSGSGRMGPSSEETGEEGPRIASAAIAISTTKGRGRRETSPMFAELRESSRSPSVTNRYTGRAGAEGGGGGTTAAASASASSSETRLLLEHRQSWTPSPPRSPIRDGSLAQALAGAKADAAGAAGGGGGGDGDGGGHSPPSEVQRLLRRRASSPVLSAHNAPVSPPAIPATEGVSDSVAHVGGEGRLTNIGSAFMGVSGRRLTPNGGPAAQATAATAAAAAAATASRVLLAPGGCLSGPARGREDAILAALAGGSSLQEAVRDVQRIDSDRSLPGTERSDAATTTAAEAAPSLLEGSAAAPSGKATRRPPAAPAAAAGDVFTGIGCIGSAGSGKGGPSPLGKSALGGSDRSVPGVVLGGSAAAVAGGAGGVGAAQGPPLAEAGGGVQVGAPRVSSTGTKGQGGTAVVAVESGSTVLGGLMPKKDRRLDISGQNRFIPRKDYPPSSMLFQVAMTGFCFFTFAILWRRSFPISCSVCALSVFFCHLF